MLTHKQKSHENKLHSPLNHVTVEFCQNKLHLVSSKLNETNSSAQ